MASNLMETRLIYNDNDIYYDTPMLERDFLGYYVDRSIGFSDDDNFVILESRHENRLDVLSFDLYGTAKLGWVIVRLNMDSIKDPIRDVKEGMVLRVPTNDRILEAFSIN
jgi:hypothetical protein